MDFIRLLAFAKSRGLESRRMCTSEANWVVRVRDVTKRHTSERVA